MASRDNSIAVLIPCYNEAPTIGKVVDDVKRVIPEANIWVFDNNSGDDTATIAREHGANVRMERRQGKGNVLRAMFNDIDADCYVLLDGDDTYPAEAIPDLCRLVLENGVDMAIGDRLSTTYAQQNKRPGHNRGNLIVRSLINRLFNGNITDIMTGYRALSRRFVKNFPILREGFEIETEMTVFALDKNYVIASMPIDYRDRPAGSTSKLNTVTDGIKVIRTILSLFVNYKPLTFFGSLALILLLVAVTALTPVFIEYFHTGLVPRFPTLFVGCSFLVLAMLLLMCGIVLKVGNQRHRQLLEILRMRN